MPEIKFSIVLVPFPFDDFASLKVRPALCLTNSMGKYKHIIIAFISSQIPEEQEESDVVIVKHSDEWKGTGMAVDSVIRLHKLVSVPQSIIKRRLGRINLQTQKEIEIRIRRLFGIR